MTIRFGIRWRLGLIVIMALIAIWLSGVAAFYIAQGAGRAAALPTPGGLVALAKAVERTGPEDRALILTAMQTKTRSVRVAAEPLTETILPSLWPADMATLDGYVRALDGRHLQVTPKEVDGLLIGPRFASAFNAVEFRIGLKGDETLVVQASSPVIVAPIGVPLGYGGGIIGVIVAIGSLMLLNRELRPLADLAAALDKFDPDSEQSFTPKARARTPEIKAVTDAFGRLQGRLATLTRSRMALIGGIQHDLRSFATRLRLRVEQIPDDQERRLAERDITDMVTLLDDALVATRVGAEAMNEELLSPATLVAVEVEDRRSVRKTIEFEVSDAAQAAMVLGDRLAIKRIVTNLLDNALRYGDLVQLTLEVDGEILALTVDDDGPGIPADQQAFLLEPFTRLDESRARNSGGAGLGLAIVNNLTEAHGGSFTIAEAPMGGARAILRLPIFRSVVA